MRYRTCVLLATTLLLSSWVVTAQTGDETLPNTVYADLRSVDAYHAAAIQDTIIAPLREELGLNDIELIIIQDRGEEYGFPASIEIWWEGRWSILPGKDMNQLSLEAISPILTPALIPSYVFFDPPLEQASLQMVTGVSLYSIDRCDLAVPYLDKVLTTDNEWLGSALFYRGNCALVSGDYDSAIVFFEQQLDSEQPSDQLAQRRAHFIASEINLAWTYLQVDREDETIALIDRFTAERLNYSLATWWDVFVLTHRAQLYALASRYADAIADINRAIDIAQNNPAGYIQRKSLETEWAVLYVLRGQMWLALYEWDQALADYNTAIILDPTYAEAYFYRGMLYTSILQTGSELHEAALADFEYYLELASGSNLADAAQDYADTIHRELQALNN